MPPSPPPQRSPLPTVDLRKRVTRKSKRRPANHPSRSSDKVPPSQRGPVEVSEVGPIHRTVPQKRPVGCDDQEQAQRKRAKPALETGSSASPDLNEGTTVEGTTATTPNGEDC